MEHTNPPPTVPSPARKKLAAVALVVGRFGWARRVEMERIRLVASRREREKLSGREGTRERRKRVGRRR